METLTYWTAQFSSFAWGLPLLIVLVGGGIFFFGYSSLLPFRYFGHAIQILRGKYDDPNDPGQLHHFQALSTAVAATVGMGNISGVAVAIAVGGPGALFWMWMSAIIGMATKFFTCTLAIMYRGKDSAGEIQGGPMYVIMEGLGTAWKPLAVFFSLAALIGALPLFTANQLTQSLVDVVIYPQGMPEGSRIHLWIGLIMAAVVAVVILGGIKRIGAVAGRLVPTMVVLYALAVGYILVTHASDIPASFQLIFKDAFTASAVLGGAVAELIRTGVRRAAFSNEAGVGTAPMAHGAAKTDEPIREGLIAMLGPAIDTLLVCTLTALAIIVTGVWVDSEANGITLTLQAFEKAMPGWGANVLMVCVAIFSVTTLFTFSYYGTKALGFLAGAKRKGLYNYIYLAGIVFGAAVPIEAVLNIIDGGYGLMAFPTMISAILLAPKVKAAAKDYFSRMAVQKSSPDS